MTAAAAIRRAIDLHEMAADELRQALAELEGAPEEATLSIKAAAFLIGISPRQMYRRARRIGVRIGREWRIDPKLLVAKEEANDGEDRRRQITRASAELEHENGQRKRNG